MYCGLVHPQRVAEPAVIFYGTRVRYVEEAEALRILQSTRRRGAPEAVPESQIIHDVL